MSSPGELQKQSSIESQSIQTEPPTTPHVKLDDGQATPNRRVGVSAMSASFSAEMYIGPIPPPLVMEGWERVLPGSAERILKMAENQSAHRIDIETKVIAGDNWRANTGLIFGFIVALVMIVGGFILIGLGHDWAGSGVITTTLVGVVGAFVYGQWSRAEERRKREATLSRPIEIPKPPPTNS